MRSLRALMVSLGVLALACLLSGGGGGGGSTPSVVFFTSDEVVLSGAEGAVPAGVALTAALATEALPAAPDGQLLAVAVDCAPDGTAFAKPVTVAVQLPAVYAEGTRLPVYLREGGAWTSTGLTATVGSDGRTARFKVTHFSTYGLMRSAAGSGQVTIAKIFTLDDVMINTSPLDWSPDDAFIACEDSASNVQRVAAQPNAVPVQVTEYHEQRWEDGGEAVAYTQDGLCYYVGWIGDDDKDMHLMLAAPNQVHNTPAPTIYRRFNANTVGGETNSAFSPDSLSLSRDGNRAFIIWGTAWALEWTGGNLATREVTLSGPIESGYISRDGAQLVYERNGQIYREPFAGGAATLVGAGTYPSWNGDGTQIGYLTEHGYALYTLGTGQTKTFTMSAEERLRCQYPRLSWDGTRFAYRTFRPGGMLTGVYQGTLVH